MTPIWDYIKEGKLPEDKSEARKLKYKAARYVSMMEICIEEDLINLC